MELYHVMAALYTGDTRAKGVQHLCLGCCDGPRACAAKMADATIAAYVELLPDKLGSTNKYYTLEQEFRLFIIYYQHHPHSDLSDVPKDLGDLRWSSEKDLWFYSHIAYCVGFFSQSQN